MEEMRTCPKCGNETALRYAWCIWCNKQTAHKKNCMAVAGTIPCHTCDCGFEQALKNFQLQKEK